MRCDDPGAGSTDMTDEEYQQAVADIKAEWKKGKKSRSQVVVKNLMEQTYVKRRQWITEERPLVQQVMKEFPCLGSTKSVSKLLYMSVCELPILIDIRMCTSILE